VRSPKAVRRRKRAVLSVRQSRLPVTSWGGRYARRRWSAGRSGPHSSAAFGELRSVSCSLQQIRADETIEVAVEDALRVADLVLGPVVLDELVRVEDVAADRVAAEAHRDAAALARQLGLALLLGLLGEPRAEDLERGVLVRRLAALVLDCDHDAARHVRDPDGRVGLVDVLAAGARRAVRVDPDVVVGDLDGAGLLEQRRDDHLREARVTAVRLVERAEAHEAMLAA